MKIIFTFLLLPLLSFGLSCGRSAGTGSSPNAPAESNAGTGRAEPQLKTPPQTSLKVGDLAPDFTLTNTEGEPVKLSDFRGKKSVVLAFYVLAFTGG